MSRHCSELEHSVIAVVGLAVVEVSVREQADDAFKKAGWLKVVLVAPIC